ncbi:MAG: putative transcriptional regulator, IclR family [Homoserinimonas sp.]|nr:putative transcriptional regulator, IclR family [Homoserinimonas sp.]
MRKPEIQKKPPYSIASVDNALRLLQLLRDTGTLRLKDAAVELDVAPSTAHRLLAMLIYRGFVIQDEKHNYVPGPAMGEGPAGVQSTRDLRLLVQPHLELLSSRVAETVNLMIRVGTKVRFLSTVEGPSILRVGDRGGAVLSARATSGGKALLAELGPTSMAKLYRGHWNDASETLDDRAYAGLIAELDIVRARGYARNDEESEDGVSALGMAIHDADRRAIAAVSVSTPVSRFPKLMAGGMVAIMSQTMAQIELDFRDNISWPRSSGSELRR